MTVAASDAAPQASDAQSKHNLRVGEVNGGASTSMIGLSDVSNEALRAALETSLRNLGYLATNDANAAYVVSVDIVDLDRPAVALDPVLIFVPVDLSVTARIHYTVKPATGGRPVFDDIVATTGTGAADSAPTPAGRVRRANEAAIGLNIAAFLQRLKADWK